MLLPVSAVGAAQLLDDEGEPERAHRVLAQRLDGRLHVGGHVGSQGVLDGLEVPVFSALVADLLAPERVPAGVERAEPFGAGAPGPFFRVPPDASAAAATPAPACGP